MASAIEFDNVSKLYRLGTVSTRTLSHDLNRWWQVNLLHREDPYLKIGALNDRSTASDSEYVWALRNINLKVEQGDVVGIIGQNGAGKSTLLKLLSRVTGPTTGTIRARGRIGSLLEVGTGFHPEMTGRENIYMNGAILGMTKQEITRKLDEIIDFSGCERYIETPVKRYSSGMMVRLGFAVAAHLDPEILVVDEVLAVGDAEFQKKAIGKMQDVSRDQGRTVLFVSHNMASIRALCKTGVLLANGTVKCSGEINDVVDCYIKDNDFKPCKILSVLKTDTSEIKIESVLVNGSADNTVHVNEGNNEITVEIQGEAYSDQIIELEAQLYDEAHVLLASYIPCHQSGRANRYRAGAFTVKDSFSLPHNLTKGLFYMDIQLSHPNVAYLITMTQPIRIISDGVISAAGGRLDYKQAGFVILD
ncbi:MAG: ABC transporter ATP-binding protein [Bacteroidaceae bacterium]|nr:ABC transporter ATP-binding protein [Bacteroidaceae bacterium]